jgi:hypothetical protein
MVIERFNAESSEGDVTAAAGAVAVKAPSLRPVSGIERF